MATEWWFAPTMVLTAYAIVAAAGVWDRWKVKGATRLCRSDACWGSSALPGLHFTNWYDLYRSGGPEALEDHCSQPSRVWNRIPDEVRERIVSLALEEPTLSPRAGGALHR